MDHPDVKMLKTVSIWVQWKGTFYFINIYLHTRACCMLNLTYLKFLNLFSLHITLYDKSTKVEYGECDMCSVLKSHKNKSSILVVHGYHKTLGIAK